MNDILSLIRQDLFGTNSKWNVSYLGNLIILCKQPYITDPNSISRYDNNEYYSYEFSKGKKISILIKDDNHDLMRLVSIQLEEILSKCS